VLKAFVVEEGYEVKEECAMMPLSGTWRFL